MRIDYLWSQKCGSRRMIAWRKRKWLGGDIIFSLESKCSHGTNFLTTDDNRTSPCLLDGFDDLGSGRERNLASHGNAEDELVLSLL